MRERTTERANERVAVIGGGLAGLTAALYAARAGSSVVVYERTSELGGRAKTREEGGFCFNMGPHALYRTGEASRVLAELGVRVDAEPPALSGAAARHTGRLHALPGGFVSLLTTGMLRLTEKIEAGRWLAGLSNIDTTRHDDRSLGDYLAAEVASLRVREMVEAFVRLSTYAHATDVISAGAALAQLQLAFAGGVLYLHGGWGRLVDSLREQAVRANVEIRCARAIGRITRDADGFVLDAQRGDAPCGRVDAVVVAAAPAECARLVAALGSVGDFVQARARATVPVRAASLELGLSALPSARDGFVLGIDEPTYFSVHSNTARLAPEGGALIHCARYLAPGESPPRDVLAKELEAIVDQAQPGWRDHAVHRQLLTDLTVTHAVAPVGGLGSRMPVVVPGGRGLFLAGDWVGGAGMLADAAFASGCEAGKAAADAAHGRAVV